MTFTRLLIAFAALSTLLSGCIPVPDEQLQSMDPRTTTITPGSFPGLDPGGKETATLHFLVKTYTSDRGRQVGELTETLYNRIMQDTGLYSYQPPGLYNIVLYADRNEFIKKTDQPDWSAGVTVGNSIYVFDGPQLGPVLAHEMCHLIFHEYMRSPRIEFRWLNEGLAVYEETQEMTAEGLRSDWRAQWRGALHDRAIPFDQMTTLVPATERARDVDLWYQQVGDIVRFIVERGGRNGFSQFLGAIRDGRTADDAMRIGFPGVWSKMSDLEAAWKGSL